MVKKLKKSINGNIVSITVLDGKEGELNFDSTALSQEIQHLCTAFGLAQKLSNAATGKSGEAAEEAILKLHESLITGNWTLRQPKVTAEKISENFTNLSPEAQEKAREVLKSLGLVIPA